MIEVNTLTVGLMALVTALATGLGALPLRSARRMTDRKMGHANAFAAGLMLAASAVLLLEGALQGLVSVGVGFLAGVAFIFATQKVLERRKDLHIGALSGADARKALLIVGAMTLHSLTEGIGVGVSYGGGERLGLFITAAIAVHNVPEGLAIALILVPRGTRVRTAAHWAVFSSLPQPLLAVPAYLAVETFQPLLSFGLGFAAGAMVWMSLKEVLPEALALAPRREVAGVAAAAAGAMLLFQALLKG